MNIKEAEKIIDMVEHDDFPPTNIKILKTAMHIYWEKHFSSNPEETIKKRNMMQDWVYCIAE